jgi:hypothetical protein
VRTGPLRLGRYWLLPILALLVVGVVLGLAWVRRGPTVTVTFQEGHGLKPGDAVRCRGIIVGEVRSVRLDGRTGGVTVQAELHPEASEVVRAGSRFWIARPLADLATGVRGLDTVVGAKYIVVQPGDGAPSSDFVGLEAPPIPETVEPGGLEVVLQAHHLGGLRPGAPVTYRQVRVGSVLRTALASDGSAVDVHAYIRPAYAPLVRGNSHFWNVSGLRVQAGLRGLGLSLESLEAVLTGGVTLATEDPPGKRVVSGKRFVLEAEEPAGWQKWAPSLPLADARLPEKAILPRPVPAVLRSLVPGRLWGTRSLVRSGLVVPVGRDLLGPADLLTVPPKSSGELTLTAQPPLSVRAEERAEQEPGVWRLASVLPRAEMPVPHLRVPAGPEECLVVGAADREHRTVAVARLTEKEGRWQVDADLFRDTAVQEWHGAAVVAVKDGQVIGVLLVPESRKEPPVVVPLDAKTAQAP